MEGNAVGEVHQAHTHYSVVSSCLRKRRINLHAAEGVSCSSHCCCIHNCIALRVASNAEGVTQHKRSGDGASIKVDERAAFCHCAIDGQRCHRAGAFGMRAYILVAENLIAKPVADMAGLEQILRSLTSNVVVAEQLLESRTHCRTNFKIQGPIIHRHLVVKHDLAQVGQIINRCCRLCINIPRHRRGKRVQLRVNVFGQSKYCRADMVGNDLVTGKGKLLVRERELHLFPLVKLHFDVGGIDVLVIRRCIHSRKHTRFLDLDRTAFRLRILVIATVHSSRHPKRILQRNQPLIGIKQRVINPQYICRHCSISC